jgi:phenylacetate-coenzyme A ligase PaaK-like adenylate-forming protein
MLGDAGFRIRRGFLSSLLSLLRVSDLYHLVAEPPDEPATPGQTRARLSALLRRTESHPFFRGKFGAFLSETAALDDDAFFARYAQLPVFTKEDYRNAGLDVLSRKYVSRIDELELRLNRGVRAALRQLRSEDFILPMATGGSSKLPLTVYMTKEHTLANLFTFFRCWRNMGWRLGDKVLIFYPAQTYNIDDLAAYNKLSALTGLRFLLFRQLDLPTVERLVGELNSYQPRLLLIFPSPLNLIAHTIRKQRLPLKHIPELINVSGETFLDCQRRNIERVFCGSRLEDSYGSVELGEIAHERAGGLEVFSDLAYVETRPQAGGSELIVTRLDLVDFPFIRYQMRDLARLQHSYDPRVCPRLVDMEGKDSNFVHGPAGQRLYPSFFNRLANAINQRFAEPPVVEIKVVENAHARWEIRLMTEAGADRPAIERAVAEHLRVELGEGVDASVRFVETFNHDYRLKYRVIERRGDTEYAGGIVGDEVKMNAVGRDAAATDRAS